MDEGVRKHFNSLKILPLTEKRKQAAQVTDLQNIKGHKDHDEIIGKAGAELRHGDEKYTLIAKRKLFSFHFESRRKSF